MRAETLSGARSGRIGHQPPDVQSRIPGQAHCQSILVDAPSPAIANRDLKAGPTRESRPRQDTIPRTSRTPRDREPRRIAILDTIPHLSVSSDMPARTIGRWRGTVIEDQTL